MKIVCAWCKKTLKESDNKNDDLVSHGICKQCKTEVLNDFKKSTKGGNKLCLLKD